MRRVRLLVLVLALVVVGWRPAFAADPAIIMVYGGPLQEPIFIVDLTTYGFMTCNSVNSPGIGPTLMGARPYLNLAINWLPRVWADPGLADRLLPRLRPEEAHQHGRPYLPARSARASVVVTDVRLVPMASGRMAGDVQETYEAVGIQRTPPRDSSEFVSGCWLTPGDVEAARAAGIPQARLHG